MMEAKAVSTAAEIRPWVFAGFPASSWAFALRVWLALLLALYVSFWLELDTPSSAALTVAIVSLPTRAQGMEKAGYRLLATAIGVIASIVIAGMFSQTDGLLIAVFGIWVGLCVYVAGILDGNRAYAAALSCITVGLIAVEQIDSPLQVFPTGVARGAAIAIGVLAVAVVNEVLAAPDYHPVLGNRLEALHRKVEAFAQGVLRGERAPTIVAAEMLRDIAALHPEIASLTTESISGTARTAAARTAMVDLVSELTLSRRLAALPAEPGTGQDDRDTSPSLITICRTFLRSEIIRRNADVRDSLEALRAGTQPRRQWRAPIYRSRRIAAGNAVRAAIHFGLIAFIFVMAGWPSTELCLTLAVAIIGLSATSPDPRAFAKLAMFAMPLACLLAGILKYLVFNGVSEFQLLAIGLAPVVIGLSLLMSLPRRTLAPLGRLGLVFTLVILAPTNPQSYDPNVFLVTCLFAMLSSILVFAAQLLLPSLSGERRVRLLLEEAHRELNRSCRERGRHLATRESAFHDAARLEQIIAASGSLSAAPQIVADAMRCFDGAVALRRCCAELDRLAESPLAGVVGAARAALDLRHGPAILDAAEALRQAAAQNSLSVDAALAALVLTSIVFEPSQALTERKRI